MAITLGSNIASLQAQRQLFRTEQNLSSVFERLSSGQRINRASDDAAGLAISESLNTDRRVFNQGIRNLNDGLSVLNIADSTVAELSGIVIRIQELAEQAANGSLSSIQRKSLDAEAQELKDEFFRVSRSADFNGLRLFDGSIENGVRLQAGYGTDGSIFSSLGGEMGDGGFQLMNSLGVNFASEEIATSDLNGDGNIDIISVGVLAGSEAQVFLGRGDGTFTDGGTFDLGNSESVVELGDLNGDGILDAVGIGVTQLQGTIAFGNGDGTFRDGGKLDSGFDSHDINIADLDGDGDADIFTGSAGEAVSIFLNDGSGKFELSQSGVGGSQNIISGDVDSDGDLDILTSAGGSTTVLLNDGAGVFSSFNTFTTGGFFSGEIALADVTGDSTLDLVALDPFNSEIEIFRGEGDGTFSSGGTYSSGGNSNALTVSDVNGDGLEDILISNGGTNSARIFLGSGGGQFSLSDDISTGGSPSDLRLADVNGDGVLDLLSANDTGGVGLLLGSTREGIAPILDFSLTSQADALQALGPLERKLQSLSEQRGTIGAFQSRLQSALNTLSATSENYAAAESRIKDADIAFESSQLTRLNILQQAAAAVLGQANLQPSLALQLLS